MQFDCSFDVTYDEASDSEELRMNIDTVSVVPSGAAKAESIYCADGEQMEKVKLNLWGKVCEHTQSPKYTQV